MSTRNGKIANLPLQIRDELNTRLFEGEPANRLADWLNAQPAVIAILEARFEGRPISEQNISEWKQGGYFEWLAIHKPLNEPRAPEESAQGAAGGGVSSERLLTVLTARHAEMIALLDIAHEDLFVRRLAALERLTHCAVAIRKCELQAARHQLERERLELLRERQRGDSASGPDERASIFNREPDAQSASAMEDRPQDGADSSPVSEPPDDASASPENLESPESESRSTLPITSEAATRDPQFSRENIVPLTNRELPQSPLGQPSFAPFGAIAGFSKKGDPAEDSF